MQRRTSKRGKPAGSKRNLLKSAREDRAQSENLVETKEEKEEGGGSVGATNEAQAAEISMASVETISAPGTTSESSFLPLPGSLAATTAVEEEKDEDKVKAMPPSRQEEGQWEQRLQAGSSRVYFFNKVTGESRWERPRNFMPRRRQSMPPLAHPLERQKTLEDAMKALGAPQPSPLPSWGGDLVSPKPSWLLSSPKAKSWLLHGEDDEMEEGEGGEDERKEGERGSKGADAESKDNKEERGKESRQEETEEVAREKSEEEKEREEEEESSEHQSLPPALLDPAEISVNKIASPKYMRKKPRAMSMLSPITDASGVSPGSHSSSYYAGKSPTNRLSTPKASLFRGCKAPPRDLHSLSILFRLPSFFVSPMPSTGRRQQD